MVYQIVYTRTAEKALAKINEPFYSKIKAAVDSLAENPRPFGYIKLHGRDGFRIRVGDYRIIYAISEEVLIVTVIDIGQRQGVYG